MTKTAYLQAMAATMALVGISPSGRHREGPEFQDINKNMRGYSKDNNRNKAAEILILDDLQAEEIDAEIISRHYQMVEQFGMIKSPRYYPPAPLTNKEAATKAAKLKRRAKDKNNRKRGRKK